MGESREAIVEALKKRLLEREAGVVVAYLFGSAAVGRLHRDSDVDVAVLLDRVRYPDQAARFERRLRLSSELRPAVRGREVDLVVLNDAPPTLARHILTTGHVVLCNDREGAHAFLRTTLSRAADLLPFLRRMRRVKLDALVS